MTNPHKAGFYRNDAEMTPIEWTKGNEFLFLNGFYKMEAMTREQFFAEYGVAPDKAKPA
jgi:hypothetical protein